MTEILKSEQQHDDEIIENLDFETPEQARERIIGEAILARTINLVTRRDSSFSQKNTPEEFVD